MSSPSTATDLAPALRTTRWFNTRSPLTLEDLRGRVVVLVAFQMLCPGCVSRSIPLAQRMDQTFDRRDLAVVGLHTVFEHHDVMTVEALEVFLSEYRVGFPVGVDEPDPDGAGIPLTMHAYRMQGTPTLVLIDAKGRRRAQYFGAHDELALGAEIGLLLAECRQVRRSEPDPAAGEIKGDCDGDRCSIDTEPQKP